MRIALMDPYDQIICFLDNDVPECMHYTQATISTYLAGDAYTMNFSVLTSEKDSELIKEGCKISFSADLTSTNDASGVKDYYLTVVKVERDEDTVAVEAWGLTLELTNEEVDSADVPTDMSIGSYLSSLGFEQDVLSIDDSRLAGEKRRIRFDNRDTILHRIYELAEAYDAEASFEIKLKPNYQLDKINLVFYKAGTRQGMGQDRTAEVIRYGENATGIKKTADISGLYTAIRPRGKSSSCTIDEVKEKWAYPNGTVRTLNTYTIKDDQKEEVRKVETIKISGKEDWVQTTINVKYKESDGRTTTMPEAVYTCSMDKPALPDAQPVYTKETPATKEKAERIMTLSGFDVWKRDDNGSYRIMGEDIRCPEARDRFPASLARNSAGAFKDGYIVRYLDVGEADDQGTLYAKALKEIQSASVPKISYQLTGYMPGNVGDWVTVEDSQYDPPLYLQCRIIEQNIDLCEPWRSSSKFDNFTTLKSQLSSQIMSTVASMKAAGAVYDMTISSAEGTVFEEGEGDHTFEAIVRDGGLDVTDDFRIIWTLNGTDIASDDERIEGNTVTINGSSIQGTAVLSCRAVKDSVIRGSCEVTLQAYYSATITQIENSDGSITIKTTSGGISKQSTIVNGANGFSPVVSLSKSGKVSTLSITDKSGTHTTQINDGADGQPGGRGPEGPAGVSPSVEVSKSGSTASVTITDASGPHTFTIEDGTNGTNGTNGVDAPTITSVTGYYYRSTSQSTVPAESSFSTSRPTLTNTYKYLWMYERYNLSNGSTINGPKHIAAVYGDTGATGSSGINGTNGSDGIGISSVSVYYYQSSSSNTPAYNSSSWSTTVPTPTASYYLHTKIEITLTSGTVNRFYLKSRNGSDGTSSTVVNNLTSTSTTSALSANQGRILSERLRTPQTGWYQKILYDTNNLTCVYIRSWGKGPNAVVTGDISFGSSKPNTPGTTYTYNTGFKFQSATVAANVPFGRDGSGMAHVKIQFDGTITVRIVATSTATGGTIGDSTLYWALPVLVDTYPD